MDRFTQNNLRLIRKLAASDRARAEREMSALINCSRFNVQAYLLRIADELGLTVTFTRNYL
jgi:hypothetical protein